MYIATASSPTSIISDKHDSFYNEKYYLCPLNFNFDYKFLSNAMGQDSEEGDLFPFNTI